MGISSFVWIVDMHMKWHEKVNMYIFIVTLLYIQKYQHNTQIYFFVPKLSLIEIYYFELCTDVIFFNL